MDFNLERESRLRDGFPGMSNRDIAQHPVRHRQTVETHLASSFRKLDITSRTELAEHLAQRY